jgi:small subunit ribosomal protein S17e
MSIVGVNKVIGRAAKAIAEKYFQRLDNTFDHNVLVVEDVAIVQSTKLRNQIAHHLTKLYKMIQEGQCKDIYIKCHEEERERKENFIPKKSILDVETVEVDSVTMEMLNKYGMKGNYRVVGPSIY